MRIDKYDSEQLVLSSLFLFSNSERRKATAAIARTGRKIVRQLPRMPKLDKIISIIAYSAKTRGGAKTKAFIDDCPKVLNKKKPGIYRINATTKIAATNPSQIIFLPSSCCLTLKTDHNASKRARPRTTRHMNKQIPHFKCAH